MDKIKAAVSQAANAIGETSVASWQHYRIYKDFIDTISLLYSQVGYQDQKNEAEDRIIILSDPFNADQSFIQGMLSSNFLTNVQKIDFYKQLYLIFNSTPYGLFRLFDLIIKHAPDDFLPAIVDSDFTPGGRVAYVLI